MQNIKKSNGTKEIITDQRQEIIWPLVAVSKGVNKLPQWKHLSQQEEEDTSAAPLFSL